MDAPHHKVVACFTWMQPGTVMGVEPVGPFAEGLRGDGASFLHSSVLRVAYVEYYIVPRTGVFTTYTRLNTGLRLQRRPELDGDLERELQ